MPFIDIKVIEDVFSAEEQRELVERVSEAVIDVGGEGIRGSTHVAITETPSGSWAPPPVPATNSRMPAGSATPVGSWGAKRS